MTLLERPYDYNWSKNDIRYVFRVPDVSLPNITGQVIIWYGSATGTDIAELITLSDLKPDSSGYIYLYIQQFLNSVLNYTNPDGTQFELPASDQTKRFYIHYREVNDNDTDPDWVEDEEDHVCWVFKGGIEKLKNSGNNFFVNYQPVAKQFMTWLPSKRFVYTDQLAFIAFLNTTGLTSVGFKLNFAFTDVAGNTYTHTYTLTNNEKFFHLHVSPVNVAYPSFTADLWYYDVQVTDSSDVALTETYRFYVEYRPKYECWDLFWHNSLGGFDGARVIGETVITIDHNYEETGAGKDVDNWLSSFRDGNLVNTAIVKRNVYKGDIGFQKSREENEALQEILLSQNIFQLLDDLWLPVLTVTKSKDLRTSKDRKFQFPIEWQLASEEEVFTPQIKNFGIGTVINACTPVQFDDSYEGMPDGQIGEAYSTSIPLTGSPPFAIVSTSGLPTGLTAVISGNNVVISGTPTTTIGTWSITIVVSNCAGNNTAPYNDEVYIAMADTHWLPATEDSVDDASIQDHELVQILGQPGEDVTIEVSTYTNSNGGTLTFDGTTVTTVGQTFTRTLDGSGLSAVFPVHIDGIEPTPEGESAIVGFFTITAATGGSLGTPLVYGISKAFTG